MTTMHEEAKAQTPRVMYIRGIPFRCPETGVHKSQSAAAAPVSQASCVTTETRATAKSAEPCVKPVTPNPFSTSTDLLARFGTACGSRAGISRAESEAQSIIVKSRRAVRVFAEKTVPMRLLRDLVISVARDGASGGKGRTQFIMVEAAPAMARVTQLAAGWLRQEGILADGVGPDVDAGRVVFGGAPHMAIAYGRSGSAADAEACGLAMARLEWAATGMGLGACFAGEMVRAAAGSSALAAALSIPTGHTAYAALFIGYPGFAADREKTGAGVRIIWL